MIIVIGSINLDLIVTLKRLPEPGETVAGKTFATAPGGKGANQALAARRAGAPVRMIGAVGRDAFAEEALALLKADGVELTGVRAVDGATGTAHILVDANGENVIVTVAGGNAFVGPDDAAAARFGAGEHVVLQNEIPLETVEAALKAARASGAITLLNTAPFRAEAARLVPMADYVIANENEFERYAEALALAGDGREARMRRFAEDMGRTIVVTLGPEGMLVASPGQDVLRLPAMEVEAVDTVAAGDTFCGYLAAGLAEGRQLEDALRRAGAAAALTCLKPGAQPAIPAKAEVERALAH